MARVQKYFEKFHSKIRADYDMDSTLREKRDIVLDRIRKHLKDSKLPGFEVLHQGSYKMKTGVKPIGTIEYDIDVGLRFSLSKEDYEPKTVRSWVLDAVEGHTKETFDKLSALRDDDQEFRRVLQQDLQLTSAEMEGLKGMSTEQILALLAAAGGAAGIGVAGGRGGKSRATPEIEKLRESVSGITASIERMKKPLV